ncbi:hypothetical protein QZH41_018623 [Actinostola sp. cb2023]|nr:hypothetical protein QZH41_018623 [Actinostola sp. cb2023]
MMEPFEESVWQRIQIEAIERHENKWQHLVDHYEQAGETAETAKIKSQILWTQKALDGKKQQRAAIHQRKFLLNKLFYKQPILEHNANPV